MRPTTRLFIAAAVLLAFHFGRPTDGAPLLAKFLLSQTNVPTFDPNIFAVGPNVDVYHLALQNPNSFPVTSLHINPCFLTSNLLNLSSSGITFRSTTNLPTLGPNKIAESFFVVPSTFSIGDILAVDVIDDAMNLSASYTRSGGGTFVPADSGDVVVAVLTVPTGTRAPFPSRSPFGSGVVNGVLEPFGFLIEPFDNCVPEPTTALLATCGLAAAITRRRPPLG